MVSDAGSEGESFGNLRIQRSSKVRQVLLLGISIDVYHDQEKTIFLLFLRCYTYYVNPGSKKIESRDFDTSLECNATPLFENTLWNVDCLPLRGGTSGILPLIRKSRNREEYIAGA